MDRTSCGTLPGGGATLREGFNIKSLHGAMSISDVPAAIDVDGQNFGTDDRSPQQNTEVHAEAKNPYFSEHAAVTIAPGEPLTQQAAQMLANHAMSGVIASMEDIYVTVRGWLTPSNGLSGACTGNSTSCSDTSGGGNVAPGPTPPTFAVQQVVGYLGYTGRAADVVATAAYDPEETFDHELSCNDESYNPLTVAAYSITSSAATSSVFGTVSPRALAALRLRTISTRVDCCTGRSAGFSPLRIRPT